MKKTIIVDNTFNNMRIDRLLRNCLGNVPQGLIEKNLRNGKIKLNKKKVKSSEKVKNGDKVDLFNFDFKKNFLHVKQKYNPSEEIVKENEDLIIEDNDDFIVLNKNSGISVQGGTKSKKNLIDIFSKSKFFYDSKPFTVHRLDKDTSGVFIIAKNRKAAQLLTTLFRLRKVYKTYLAVCHGELSEDYGIFNNDLIRYEGKKKVIEKAETNFKVLDKNSNSSLVLMKPITGRKHQLRKHLFAHGHSILGDKKYNPSGRYAEMGLASQLQLHARKLVLHRGGGREVNIEAPLPDQMNACLTALGLSAPN